MRISVARSSAVRLDLALQRRSLALGGAQHALHARSDARG